MAQAPAQQPSGSDNSLAPVWITILLFVTLYVLWAVGHQHIVSFVFFLNVQQAKLITYFLGDQHLVKELYLMQTLDPSTVTWDQLMELTGSVGDYMRYPVIVLLAIFAFWLYQSDVTLKYRKAHSMETLRTQEQTNWPSIMPIVKYNLIEEDINKGPWATALTPMEFARKYQLLKKEDILLDNPGPGLEQTAGIRRGDAKRVFTLQLGPYWDGFERTPHYVQSLAAVFMARMHRDRDNASHILSVLDKSVAAGKPDFAVGVPILKKYQNTEMVRDIFDAHAYLLTVMASLLQHSRADGVVPSSEFLWLKAIDRRLWYMLNCVGRQTPYAEVAGPFAHWQAERVMKRRSIVPMIDEAIKALEIAVKQVKLSAKELRELEP